MENGTNKEMENGTNKEMENGTNKEMENGTNKGIENGTSREMLTESNTEGHKLGPRRLCVVLCILCCELCERITYYSVQTNLVLFCTSVLKYTDPDAATISLVFAGVVYMIPVAGGYVSDALAGRYNTILGSALIYLIGLVLLPAAAFDYTGIFAQSADGYSIDMSVHSRRAFYLVGLTFIAIGTGGIKANVGPFGAQQVESEGKQAVQTFFNWFYWFVNAGGLVAHTAVAYIQQNISWSWGFSVPLFSMILAIIFFVSARNNYQHTPPGESILVKVFAIYRKGCGGHFDSIRKKNGGQYDDYTVDGALSVLRVLPVFLLMIFYWAIYSQMPSTYYIQALRMDAKVGDTMIPVAILNAFNTSSILLLIPLVDRLLYPCLKKLGRPPTHLQRMGVGLLLAGASVAVAGVIEIYRKQDISTNGPVNQILGGKEFEASKMSVFVQVPEYALVGASEVFASITGLEFAFTQAPPSMQGLLTGLFMMTSGLGSFVSSAILKIVEAATKSDPWFPEEINKGKIENLFFLMAGLMVVNFIAFVFVARWYKYLASPPTDPQSSEPEPDGDTKLAEVTTENDVMDTQITKL